MASISNRRGIVPVDPALTVRKYAGKGAEHLLHKMSQSGKSVMRRRAGSEEESYVSVQALVDSTKEVGEYLQGAKAGLRIFYRILRIIMIVFPRLLQMISTGSVRESIKMIRRARKIAKHTKVMDELVRTVAVKAKVVAKPVVAEVVETAEQKRVREYMEKIEADLAVELAENEKVMDQKLAEEAKLRRRKRFPEPVLGALELFKSAVRVVPRLHDRYLSYYSQFTRMEEMLLELIECKGSVQKKSGLWKKIQDELESLKSSAPSAFEGTPGEELSKMGLKELQKVMNGMNDIVKAFNATKAAAVIDLDSVGPVEKNLYDQMNRYKQRVFEEMGERGVKVLLKDTAFVSLYEHVISLLKGGLSDYDKKVVCLRVKELLENIGKHTRAFRVVNGYSLGGPISSALSQMDMWIEQLIPSEETEARPLYESLGLTLADIMNMPADCSSDEED